MWIPFLLRDVSIEIVYFFFFLVKCNHSFYLVKVVPCLVRNHSKTLCWGSKLSVDWSNHCRLQEHLINLLSTVWDFCSTWAPEPLCYCISGNYNWDASANKCKCPAGGRKKNIWNWSFLRNLSSVCLLRLYSSCTMGWSPIWGLFFFNLHSWVHVPLMSPSVYVLCPLTMALSNPWHSLNDM
jgi:hypothetical protein